MRTLRIGLCQVNTTVGDIEGNTCKILDAITKGKRMGWIFSPSLKWW